MTKRSNNKISNFPGLFDDLNLNLDNVPSSILSDIARHVRNRRRLLKNQEFPTYRAPTYPRNNL